jgi:hypothetical protein
MDIVNWSALQNNLLVRDTLNSPDDLVLIGANATWNKRGDKFQTYAVPVSALVGGSGAVGIQRNGVLVSAAATILNFVGASSVSGDPLVTVTIPVGPRIFRSGAEGTTVTTFNIDTTTYSVLIPAKTITAESVVRITYRVRFLSTPISTTWTQPTITVNPNGPTPDNTFLIGYDRMINGGGPQALVSQMTRTIAVDKNGQSVVMDNKGYYTDDNIETSVAESPLSIDWTRDQYIVFGIRHILQPAQAQGAFYLIEIF